MDKRKLPKTEEHKRKIGLANRGKIRTSEMKQKLSIARKGKHFSPKSEFKKGMIPWNKNKPGYKTTQKSRYHSSTETYRKDESLRLAYGINLIQYLDLVRKQKGKCLICGHIPVGKKKYNLYVDHCHKTGKNRGLLCHQCNLGMGLLKDDIGVILSALRYLQFYERKNR